MKHIDMRAIREGFKAVEQRKKAAVQASPYGGTFHLPNKSLCDPVRASVSTSTSSSIR